jgi:hypothetical protein
MVHLPLAGSHVSFRLYFHCASRVFHPNTRIYVRLLGPCFKTGRKQPFCQHPGSALRLPGSTPLQLRHRFCTTSANEAGPTYSPTHFLSPSPSFHRQAITVPRLATHDLPSHPLSPAGLRTDADLHGYGVPPLTLLSGR